MARTSSTTRRQHTTAKRTGRASRAKRPTSRRASPLASAAGLQEFLEEFAQALTSGDGEAAAACFEYPCAMVMSDPEAYGPNHVFQDQETAARFFAEAPRMDHERGIEDTFPGVEQVQDLGSGLLLARVRFPYIDADGNDMGDGETSLYVLRRRPQEGYAIASVVTLGADADRA